MAHGRNFCVCLGFKNGKKHGILSKYAMPKQAIFKPVSAFGA